MPAAGSPCQEECVTVIEVYNFAKIGNGFTERAADSIVQAAVIDFYGHIEEREVLACLRAHIRGNVVQGRFVRQVVEQRFRKWIARQRAFLRRLVEKVAEQVCGSAGSSRSCLFVKCKQP